MASGKCLQNLRFADDVLLVGKSLREVECMLQDLFVEAGLAGLELHPKKTKLLSNQRRRRKPSARAHVRIGGDSIELLPVNGQTEYLGRVLSLTAFYERSGAPY